MCHTSTHLPVELHPVTVRHFLLPSFGTPWLLSLDTGTPRHMDALETSQAANVSEGDEVNKSFSSSKMYFQPSSHCISTGRLLAQWFAHQWDLEPNCGSRAVICLFLHFLEPHMRPLRLLTNHVIQQSLALTLYCCVSYQASHRCSHGSLRAVISFCGSLISGCLVVLSNTFPNETYRNASNSLGKMKPTRV